MAAKHTGKQSRFDDGDYPLVGETLGLWRLVRGIGRGGMGEVYEAEYDYLHLLTLRYSAGERMMIRQELAQLSRAEQSRMASELLGSPLPDDVRFAIKICSARRGTAGYKRFIQEAEMAQRLGEHPYIVGVHAIHRGAEEDGTGGATLQNLDIGPHRDLAFMVMDLAVRDYDHAKLTLSESIHIIRCIATALDHAHHMGVVHRDLKPENILGSVETPLLTDFGIAKEIDQSLGLTRTGQIIGTLDYMSPEQATDAKTVDHRSDIYSLGVVLYEFATNGQLPYLHHAEREACLAAIRSEKTLPKWPRDHQAKFPRSLERVILKATAHRPENRYQEMSDFIADLDRFARGDWISPLGRVPLRTGVRYYMQRHTKAIVIGGGIFVLIFLLWISTKMYDAFDRTRIGYLERLEKLEFAAKPVGSSKQQLSRVEREGLQTLLSELSSDRQRRYYTDILDRAKTLSDSLRGRRYLSVAFDTPAEVGSNPLEEFTTACGTRASSWSLKSEGLLFTDKTTLTLSPYGSGQLYFYIDVLLRDCVGDSWRDFEVSIRGQELRNAPLRMCFRGTSQGPRLILDAGGVAPLRWSGETTARVSVGFSSKGKVFSYLPLQKVREEVLDHGLMGPGESAEIRIVIPKNAILKRLDIFPNLPEPVQ